MREESESGVCVAPHAYPPRPIATPAPSQGSASERAFPLVYDGLIFSTSRGRPQSRRNALRAVQTAGDAAGLNPEGGEKVGLHDLRHSLVALALDAGLSLAEVAVLTRHANAHVTAQVYAGHSDSGRKGIAAKLAAAGVGT